MAAGSGTRMESEVPKQFLLLQGKPILSYSLQAFYDFDPQIELIVVLAITEMPRWERLCEEYHIHIPHQMVIGGATRTESVKRGLALVKEEGWVAIHDGARPLLEQSIIQRTYAAADLYGSGIACVKPKDSIRQVNNHENAALDREQLRLIQTPQTFRVSLIKSAFERFGEEASSDDATVLEKAGHTVHLVEGAYTNIKVTTPEDLELASSLLKNARH